MSHFLLDALMVLSNAQVKSFEDTTLVKHETALSGLIYTCKCQHSFLRFGPFEAVIAQVRRYLILKSDDSDSSNFFSAKGQCSKSSAKRYNVQEVAHGECHNTATNALSL